MKTTENMLACGINAFQNEDFETAVECLKAAMADEPQNPLPFAYMSFACARQGLLQEAHDFITQALSLAPERIDFIAALGETLLKAGKPFEAAEYLREALNLQPDLFAAYPALAQSLHLTGQSEEAVLLLETVCDLPSDAQENIRNALLQILAERGDLLECQHASRFLARLHSTMQDGLLRVRITNRCNAKCRFCGTRFWPEDVQKMSVRNEILYKYLKPIYEQIKILLLTGGDPLITAESMSYCRFISENYPRVTMILETNGIAFTAKWQRLAMESLMSVHVSVNASNEEVYSKGCWEGGKAAYRKFTKNIRDYMARLRESGLEVFAPDVSMVINRDTAHDVRDFVKYALTEKLRHVMFFFDYTENNMAGNYFGCPTTSRMALFELMKLERVLAGKLFVYFRLWIPLKEAEMIQPMVEAIPIENLRKEYSEILELAGDRSMRTEYEARQRIRRSKGKKEFTFDEDWTSTIRQIAINGKDTCFAPFNSLDIYPDEKFECCGWINPRFSVNAAVKDDVIDWEKEYNSPGMKKIRLDMLMDNYGLCQKCCPLNPTYNNVCSSHKYGYDRID
ncbi:MAG: radical SAM protein [Betaproteobacteria bacterium]|nr:radical SAM protein [Betaproteobacteria bacterium]